jgi:hypothetical protein
MFQVPVFLVLDFLGLRLLVPFFSFDLDGFFNVVARSTTVFEPIKKLRKPTPYMGFRSPFEIPVANVLRL